MNAADLRPAKELASGIYAISINQKWYIGSAIKLKEWISDMNQAETIKLIDDHKNNLINPIEMLDWTWIRVIINSISPDEWEELNDRASEVMSK